MLKLIAVIADLVQRFFQWREAEAHRVEGRDQQRRDDAAQVKEEVHEAEKVRQDVRDAVADHPEQLRDDDGFKRPD